MPKPTVCALGGSAAELMNRAREEERRDIARELHDTVIQPLSILVTNVDCVLRQPPSEGSLEAYLDAWRELAQEALNSLRLTLAGLHTHPHAQFGMPIAVERFLIPVARSHGLRCTLECDGWPTNLAVDWTTSLYLAVREAFTNAQKYAHATEIAIVLEADTTKLHITIADNGVGFDVCSLDTRQPARTGTSTGITGIRDRLLALGGHLTLITAPGNGTRLEMYVPRPLQPGPGCRDDTLAVVAQPAATAEVTLQ